MNAVSPTRVGSLIPQKILANGARSNGITCETSYKCPKCLDTGVIVRNGMRFSCKCAFAQNVETLRRRSGLPTFSQRPLTNLTRDYVMRFQAIRDSGRNWIAYMGRSGSGKSTQAFMAVDALLKRKKPVWSKVYYYPELVRELSSYRFDAEKFEEKIDELLEPDLVLLDDYLDVVPKPESFEEQVALTLIKRRYVQRAPLILTTELAPSDFPRLMPRHGEAIFGRVLEMSDRRVEVYGAKSVNYRFQNATAPAKTSPTVSDERS